MHLRQTPTHVSEKQLSSTLKIYKNEWLIYNIIKPKSISLSFWVEWYLNMLYFGPIKRTLLRNKSPLQLKIDIHGFIFVIYL